VPATSDPPRANRLETVHIKRQAPPRRDRIRGWIAESALREAADRKRAFAERGR